MSDNLRLRFEVAAVRYLLERAAGEGFKVCSIDDGEGRTHVASVNEAMKLIFNLDDCYLNFRRHSTDRAYWVRIVLGNSGWDSISDYGSVEGPWNKLIEGVCKVLEHGMITLTPCPRDIPAWNHGPKNRGQCIKCGGYHGHD